MPYRNLSTLPVYRKALDLCHISREIAAYVSYNKDLLNLYKSESQRTYFLIVEDLRKMV